MTERRMTDKEMMDRVADYARGIQSMAKVSADKRLFITDHLIETGAYHILETYRSRPRAIWRYVRYAFKQWAMDARIQSRFKLRVWRHQLHGYSRKQAVEKAFGEVVEKYS